MSIPKVIHYCWFGKGEKSELLQKCMDSWKKFCPDWQIIEWNEENFNPYFCPYAEKAYKQKRYGFLADVARLQIIYEHGGVYLDTDVELIHSIDELLNNCAWFAYGMSKEINTGSGFGAEQGNWMVKKLLENYKSFTKNTRFDVCTTVDTKVFHKYYSGFAADHNVAQMYNGVLIINDIWRYVIHHYTGSWRSKPQLMKDKILNKIQKNN